MYISEHLKKRHMREADGLMQCWDCGGDECRCDIKLITDAGTAEAISRVYNLHTD